MEDDDDYDAADAGGGSDDVLAGLMHRLAGISTSDPAELQRQFAELLGISQDQAAFFLSAAGGNLEAAVNLFLDFSRSATAPPPAVGMQRSQFYLDAIRSGVTSEVDGDGDALAAASLQAAERRPLASEGDYWPDDDAIPPELEQDSQPAGDDSFNPLSHAGAPFPLSGAGGFPPLGSFAMAPGLPVPGPFGFEFGGIGRAPAAPGLPSGSGAPSPAAAPLPFALPPQQGGPGSGGMDTSDL